MGMNNTVFMIIIAKWIYKIPQKQRISKAKKKKPQPNHLCGLATPDGICGKVSNYNKINYH